MTEKLLTNKKHGIPMLILLLSLYIAAAIGLVRGGMSDNFC